jgi:hypothetical protein
MQSNTANAQLAQRPRCPGASYCSWVSAGRQRLPRAGFRHDCEQLPVAYWSIDHCRHAEIVGGHMSGDASVQHKDERYDPIAEERSCQGASLSRPPIRCQPITATLPGTRLAADQRSPSEAQACTLKAAR